MRWICVVQMDITQIRAFNLVTLPKVEHFNIDKSGGGKFTSTVDKFVEVTAPPGTFDKEGDLSLEVLIHKNIKYKNVNIFLLIPL